MDEDVEMSPGSRAGIVQQARALRLEAFHSGGEIRNSDGDVMETFAALLDEPGDHGIRCGGFQQLNARPPGRQHRDLHFFLLHSLTQADGESQLLFVELQRGVERPHGDAQVINSKFVGASHR